jgi:hypothetical protein
MNINIPVHAGLAQAKIVQWAKLNFVAFKKN